LVHTMRKVLDVTQENLEPMIQRARDRRLLEKESKSVISEAKANVIDQLAAFDKVLTRALGNDHPPNCAGLMDDLELLIHQRDEARSDAEKQQKLAATMAKEAASLISYVPGAGGADGQLWNAKAAEWLARWWAGEAWTAPEPASEVVIAHAPGGRFRSMLTNPDGTKVDLAPFARATEEGVPVHPEDAVRAVAQREDLHYDENTLTKIHFAFQKHGVRNSTDLISELQNIGILFRERPVEDLVGTIALSQAEELGRMQITLDTLIEKLEADRRKMKRLTSDMEFLRNRYNELLKERKSSESEDDKPEEDDEEDLSFGL
jgi:hypothetical protein